MELTLEQWPDRLIDWATTSGIRIVAIVLGAIAFYWSLRAVSRKLLTIARKVTPDDRVTREQEVRAKTLAGIIRGLLVVVLIVVVALMVLDQLGYNVGPLIAGAGIVGVAVGFGAQTLIKDLIGGFFIILEGQFFVSDVIQVGSVRGTVEAIRLRTTLVRDSDGILHLIPNGEMRMVSNLTKGWSRVTIDVKVDYREDLDRVVDILNQVGEQATKSSAVAECIIETPVVLGVEQLEGKAVTIRMVGKTIPFEDDRVARELRQRIASSLAEHRIALGEAPA